LEEVSGVCSGLAASFAESVNLAIRTPVSLELGPRPWDGYVPSAAFNRFHAEWAPQVPDVTQPTDERIIVHVSTAEELVAALADNTTIVLAEGQYDLATVGNTLNIHGRTGLSILGSGADVTHIVTPSAYAQVIDIDNTRDITLRGFSAGHVPEADGCEGAVLIMNRSQNVSLESVDLFGSGTVGLVAANTTGLFVSSSVIRECTRAAVSFSSVDAFVDTFEIRDTGGEQSLVTLTDSALILENAVVQNNGTGSPLVGGEPFELTLIDVEVDQNYAACLTSCEECLDMQSVNLGTNRFEELFCDYY